MDCTWKDLGESIIPVCTSGLRVSVNYSRLICVPAQDNRSVIARRVGLPDDQARLAFMDIPQRRGYSLPWQESVDEPSELLTCPNLGQLFAIYTSG